MPSQPPIPHILFPYLTHSTHSAQSLTIITSVLAATPNWLVLRYLHSVLSAAAEHHDSHQESGRGKKRRRRAKRVVLISFLREWLFWKGEGKRLGLDLQRFVDGNRLRFVDGLSGLFDVPQQQQQQQQPRGNVRSGLAMGSGRSIPMHGAVGAASPRGPPPTVAASAATTPSQANVPTPQQKQQKQLHSSGRGIAALNQLENEILSVIKSFPKPNATDETGEEEDDDGDGDDILLILDQPDLILAAVPGIDANDMYEWVMGLQQHVLSTIITISADAPLIHNANTYTANDSAATPLEKNHASFVVGLAHRADMVLQLRTLDTGAAKDVSGVLRVSRGGGYQPELEGGKEDEVVEKEVLYFVQRDGGVRVFGRGEV